jgi:hypothetical protein
VEEKNLTDKFLEAFVFTNIFKTFRFAIQPGKMAIALLAVVALVVSGMLMDLRPTVVASPGAVTEDIAAAPETGIFVARPATELHAALGGYGKWADYVTTYDGIGTRIGVFSAMWEFCSARFDGIAIAIVKCDIASGSENLWMAAGAVWWALRYHPLYTSSYLVLALLILSLAGGAVCRSAALQFARDERTGLVESLRYSSRRFASFLTAPVWAAGLIVLMGLFLAALGLLGNIPLGVGPIAIGILSPLAAFTSLLMAIFLVGLVVGGSFMFPAVAYEGSDGMDAMGRAFGYIYLRPWRTVFYITLTFFYGMICYLFVRIFAFIVLLIGRACLGAAVFATSDQAVAADGTRLPLIDAIWPRPSFETLFHHLPESLAPAEKVAAILIMVPHALVTGLVAAFLMSFFFCACTVVYALLRRHVDGEPFERIFTKADGSPMPGADEPDTADAQ